MARNIGGLHIAHGLLWCRRSCVKPLDTISMFVCCTVPPLAQQEAVVPLPLLLPHELIEMLLLLCQDGTCMETRQHLQNTCDKLRVPEILGSGLWLDGVPCNWDRTASLEVDMSLPGLPAGAANLRLPLTVIEHKFCYKHNTMDDILDVIEWSFRCVAIGVMPTWRHNGTAWKSSDGRRGRLAARPIGVQGWWQKSEVTGCVSRACSDFHLITRSVGVVGGVQ